MSKVYLIIDDREVPDVHNIISDYPIWLNDAELTYDRSMMYIAQYPENQHFDTSDVVLMKRADKQVAWVEDFMKTVYPPFATDLYYYVVITRSVFIAYAFRVMLKEGKLDCNDFVQLTIKDRPNDEEQDVDVIVSTYDKDGRAPDSSNYDSHCMSTYGDLLGRII